MSYGLPRNREPAGWDPHGLPTLDILPGQQPYGIPHFGGINTEPLSPTVGQMRTNGQIRTMAVVGRNLYIGGDFTVVTNPSGTTIATNYLAKFDLSRGIFDAGFRPDITGGSTVFGVQPVGNQLYVIGDFSAVGGTTRHGVALLDLTVGGGHYSNLITSFNAGLDAGATVVGLIFAHSSLYLCGQFTVSGVTNISKHDTYSGAVDTGFSTLPGNPTRAAYSLQNYNTSIYIGSGEITYNGNTRNHYAAVAYDTGSVQSFNPNFEPNGVTQRIRGQYFDGEKIMVTGIFDTVNGATIRRSGAVVDLAGNVQAWNPDVQGGTPEVVNFLVDGSRVYLGGNFTNLNNGAVSRTNLAVVDYTDGICDRTFNANMAGGQINTMLIYGSTLIVGGNFNPTTFGTGSAMVDRYNIAFLDPATGAVK